MDTSAQLIRARKTAVTLATVSIICLLANIYTWMQKGASEEHARQLTEELARCRQEKK